MGRQVLLRKPIHTPESDIDQTSKFNPLLMRTAFELRHDEVC